MSRTIDQIAGRCERCANKYAHCKCPPIPHLCPPLSQELRQRIEAENAQTDERDHYDKGYCDALRWVIGTADSLARTTAESRMMRRLFIAVVLWCDGGNFFRSLDEKNVGDMWLHGFISLAMLAALLLSASKERTK